MVVEQQGRSGKRGLDRPHPARERDRFLVQRAIQAPPDALEDLHEAARRRRRPRHASGKGAVEVGVGVDESREDERARQVQDLLAGRGGERGAPLDDGGAVESQVRLRHEGRVEGRERRVPEEHPPHGRRPESRAAVPRGDRRGRASSGGRLTGSPAARSAAPDVLEPAAGEDGERGLAPPHDAVRHCLPQTRERRRPPPARRTGPRAAPSRAPRRGWPRPAPPRTPRPTPAPRKGPSASCGDGRPQMLSASVSAGPGVEVAAGRERVDEGSRSRGLDAEHPRAARAMNPSALHLDEPLPDPGDRAAVPDRHRHPVGQRPRRTARRSPGRRSSSPRRATGSRPRCGCTSRSVPHARWQSSHVCVVAAAHAYDARAEDRGAAPPSAPARTRGRRSRRAGRRWPRRPRGTWRRCPSRRRPPLARGGPGRGRPRPRSPGP